MIVADPVADGLHVILAMLIVACVFIGVIALGELTHRAGERRRERKSRLRPY